MDKSFQENALFALMADHMSREESYYLMKLAETAGTPLPENTPAKPRIIHTD